jgi:hypothetical protein
LAFTFDMYQFLTDYCIAGVYCCRMLRVHRLSCLHH